MTKEALDDLQAVRSIIDTLQQFPADDRERILRWAREKLGMAFSGTSVSLTPRAPQVPVHQLGSEPPARAQRDIKSFVQEKAPKSDRQLAATVAYYYAFEAPQGERKESIGSQDLIDACRKAGIRRPTNPGQTLRNSAHAGYLDKAAESGHYRLNSVGENLVAMVLPDGAPNGVRAKQKTKRSSHKVGSKKSLTRPKARR